MEKQQTTMKIKNKIKEKSKCFFRKAFTFLKKLYTINNNEKTVKKQKKM